ncbi:MAG: undecaprenyldiphospho-muramoylpentapeptide beta-N-acetylglucosaminyltransferase [Desulfobacteraceae bacterium]|jgi:UDP-N-acetylglucosamine--N-acetylmuramyl-(pentapeptide) pyrophosphoryl-undecaprenol N-acetylglucosamine transferase
MRDPKEEKERTLRIIIAGGGTGGHLFPGVAVAMEMCRRYEDAKILFVTGERKMESEILSRSGFLQASIAVEGIKGRGWKKGAMVVLKLPWGFLQSMMIIKRFSPRLVLGVGGYSSGPVCLAARMMGIPSAVHEQNSFPGLTNRLLCKRVDRVFIAFEESRAHFPGGSLFLTGNPIREALLKEKAPEERRDTGFTVLVMGGSQGARAINEAFVESLAILRNRGRDPVVIHQTGERDYSRVLEAYRQRGLEGKVTPFIQEMADAYNRANIVVSRAGASTVSELAALGKPSILIPYPHAANRHQETNAGVLVQVGGAEMVLQKNLSGEGLADLLMRYMDDRVALQKMGDAARRVGRPDAARVIADLLMDMIEDADFR